MVHSRNKVNWCLKKASKMHELFFETLEFIEKSKVIVEDIDGRQTK